MDEMQIRIMVVNRVNDYLDELTAKHAGEKIKVKVESMFKDDEFKRLLYWKTRKVVEELCDESTRPELVRIIKKNTRPQIIYVHEPPKIPPQLEPFAVKEHFMAPIGPCIYFLCREDRIVYIGQSVNMGQRLSQHIQCKNFDRMFYFNVAAEDLNKVETELIEYYDPELNKTCNMNRVFNERQRR